jgi:hypothetical protein
MIDLAASYPLIYGAPIPEVWVAGGTYTPQRSALGVENAGRDNSFRLRAGVKVYGGFAGTETAIGQRSFTLPPADQINPNQWGALVNAAHETILSGDIGNQGDASDNVYNGLSNKSLNEPMAPIYCVFIGCDTLYIAFHRIENH